MAEDVQVDDIVLSLYESCVKVISDAFAFIKVNYLKDLPNHVLEDIISSFNPLDLESIENNDNLSEKGISTESLWKTHHSNRWRRGIMVKFSSPLETMVCSTHTWRARYFQRHFHELINRIACSWDNDSTKILQDSTEELYKRHQRQSRYSTRFIKRDIRLESIDGMIDLCLKHMNQLRLYNATCKFLNRRSDVLMKFAPSIVHLEIHHLRDNGVESLSKILSFLFAHNLTSFALFSCKVQSKDNVRILMTAISRSTSAKSELRFKTDHEGERKVAELALLSGVPKGSHEKSRVKITDGLNNSSLSEMEKSCLTAGDLRDKKGLSSKQHKVLAVNEENCVTVSEENCVTVNEENCVTVNEEKCEDDLYEDIFSGNFDDENKSADMMSDSCQGTDDYLRSPESNVEYSYLTELEYFSYLMGPLVHSQAIVNCNLHTLKLVDTGSGISSEMSNVIKSIHCLVMNGSLRDLVIESDAIHDHHGIMLSEMLVGCCQKCCTPSSKGLRSLRLSANALNKTTARCIARKISSCSNCEGRTAAACRCNTYKNVEPGDCNVFLTNNILLSVPDNGALGMSDVETSEGTCSGCVGEHNDSHCCSCICEDVCDTKRTPGTLDPTSVQFISHGIEFLHLQSVNITSDGARAIARSLLLNRSVQSLQLPSSRLHTDDVAAIFNCIAGCDQYIRYESNHAIKQLVLRNNSYDASSDGSLFNLISRSHLVHLDLSSCGLKVISDEVVSALSCNSTLEVLKIAGNRLGDKGGTAICNVFKGTEQKSMLSSLDLSYNLLTASSLIHLGQVLTSWPRKLREIKVQGNLLDGSLEDVETCLNRVFDDVIITETLFDYTLAYVDYVSVM